jgi:hypothetical protein
MPMYAMESYTPLLLGVDAAQVISSAPCSLGGFSCAVAGTLTVRRESVSGDIVLDTLPVTAGAYHPIPYAMPTGAYVALAGGARGTILWNPM